jgi:hypothetical protein
LGGATPVGLYLGDLPLTAPPALTEAPRVGGPLYPRGSLAIPSNHQVSAAGGRLVAYYASSVQSADPTTDTAWRVESLPSSQASSPYVAAPAPDGRLWYGIQGSYTAFTVCDPARRTWSNNPTPAFPVNTGLSYMGFAWIAGRLVVCSFDQFTAASRGVWSWAPGEAAWRQDHTGTVPWTGSSTGIPASKVVAMGDDMIVATGAIPYVSADGGATWTALPNFGEPLDGIAVIDGTLWGFGPSMTKWLNNARTTWTQEGGGLSFKSMVQSVLGLHLQNASTLVPWTRKAPQ